MSWTRVFRRRYWDEERKRELEAYVREDTDDNIARGMSPEEARYAAYRKLGNITLIREEIYHMNSLGWFESFWQDTRYGLRQLRRSPGFTGVAVLTLALGIGANIAMFSVINGVLLRPLPFGDVGRLVGINFSNPTFPSFGIRVADFVQLSEQRDLFQQSAMSSTETRDFLAADGTPQEVEVGLATAGYFDTLGVKATLGRTFRAGEDRPGNDQLALLSGAFWRKQFNADSHILGKAIILDGQSCTVVGVLPSDFATPSSLRYPGHSTESIWVPAPLAFEKPRKHSIYTGEVIARLAKGASITQAAGRLHGLSMRWADHLKEETNYNNFEFHPISMQEYVAPESRLALLILFGAVGFVLLIACVNVASLTLARETGRERELALRESLGASRLRVIQQLLLESLLLAVGGGSLGILGAAWGVKLLVAIAPSDTPRLTEVRVDLTVAAFALAISAAVTMLVGLLPALHLSKIDLDRALREGGASLQAGRGNLRQKRIHSVLVVAQTALATVLLVGAGLLIHSFWKLTNMDRGFNSKNLLVVWVKVKHLNRQQFNQYFQDAQEQVTALPGVVQAAVASAMPMDVNISFFECIQERQMEKGRFPLFFRAVSPGYFAMIGQPLVKGRGFTGGDNAIAPQVAIINESFARRYLPDMNPLGKHVVSPLEDHPFEIVGVVKDADDFSHLPQGVEGDTKSEVYFPIGQWGGTFLIVRTRGDPMKMVPAVRGRILSISSERPAMEFSTTGQTISSLNVPPRFRFVLMTTFAVMALALALVGIYGVVYYGVAQRTHEFGIRMALGAERSDLLARVLAQGFAVVSVGVAIGLAGSLALARLLAAMLYEVKPHDLATLFFAPALFTTLAMVACYLPARRATKVDPMVALRYE
jgi:putative ABC transport system permease protein